jgi:hypothetical protein
LEPATVTVHVSDTVEWKSDDIVAHTATADHEAIHTGAAWRYVARKNGTYNYICSRHPNMKGKLIVQQIIKKRSDKLYTTTAPVPRSGLQVQNSITLVRDIPSWGKKKVAKSFF